MSALEKFLDLLRESVILQGILTLSVCGVWLFLVASGKTVPDALTNIVGLVIGFYFGGKIQLAINKSKGGE
jgi:hypothetical protein